MTCAYSPFIDMVPLNGTRLDMPGADRVFGKMFGHYGTWSQVNGTQRFWSNMLGMDSALCQEVGQNESIRQMMGLHAARS
ncbi:hypothetical protein D3C71_909210 [compost metagenome]